MKFDWTPELHGKILLDLRRTENMTQEMLGKKLQIAQPIVSQIESGKQTPSSVQVEAIIDIFGLQPFVDGSSTKLEANSLLSNWLRHAMEEKSMTVKDLVERTGLSRTPIDSILNGKDSNPRVRTKEKLQEALGIQIDQDIEAEIKRDADLGVDGVGAFTDFDPYDWNDVPRVPGIYVFYDISDRPIYVGMGSSIYNRCRDHEQKFWYKSPVVYKASYVEVPDRTLREQIERVMIRFMKSNAVINKQLVDRDENDPDERKN